MDADEDPGGPVLPTLFYGLWPRAAMEDDEMDVGAESHGEFAGTAAG